MRRWEYKTLYRARGIKAADSGWHYADDWVPDVKMSEIEALGEEGWELVTVASVSSIGGRIDWRHPSTFDEYIDAQISPPVYIEGANVSGMTTSQTFYFKREKTIP